MAKTTRCKKHCSVEGQAWDLVQSVAGQFWPRMSLAVLLIWSRALTISVSGIAGLCLAAYPASPLTASNVLARRRTAAQPRARFGRKTPRISKNALVSSGDDSPCLWPLHWEELLAQQAGLRSCPSSWAGERSRLAEEEDCRQNNTNRRCKLSSAHQRVGLVEQALL